MSAEPKPDPAPPLTREDILAHLHLLTPDDVLALLRPLFVLRGRLAGPGTLTLGRGLVFLADHRVGGHVFRFKNYADLRGREVELRQAMERRALVTTEFEVVLPPGSVPVVEAPPEPVPSVPAVPKDPEAEALEAAKGAWESRWSAREGVLHRTLESTLRHTLDSEGIEADRHCGKAPMIAAILAHEKSRALHALAVRGETLPDVPEALPWRQKAAPTPPVPPPAAPLETAAGVGNFLTEPEESAVPAEIPLEVLQTMKMDQLRALAAAHGITKTDRRDLVRALAKAANLQPA